MFDDVAKEPSRFGRYLPGLLITAIVLAIIWGVIWELSPLWLSMLRFHGEKAVAEQFLGALEAGNLQRAYQVWKPLPAYSFQDFQSDWGPTGEYGPVNSYQIQDIQAPKDGSGVVITIDISPYKPFPAKNDAVEQSKTKEVKVWVQFSDHSMSYPPL